MIIDCISDLHGHYPTLEGGDLLIVAGDLTAADTEEQMYEFYSWLDDQNYKKKVFTGGNHDNRLKKYGSDFFSDWTDEAQYLCDSGIEFEGLKIWGSPWTLTFEGINPHCTAFTGDENLLAEKFALIPDDVDILITHGPPYGTMDTVTKYGPFSHEREVNVGSEALSDQLHRIRPKLHVFGHIHEGYGQYRPMLDLGRTKLAGYPISVNCSHMNEDYEPVNKPIRIIL